MEQINLNSNKYISRWYSDLVDIINSAFLKIESEVPSLVGKLNTTDPAPTEDFEKWMDQVSSTLNLIQGKMDEINSRLMKLEK